MTWDHFIQPSLNQNMLGQREGHLAQIFVDTGANCNIISRKFYSTLQDQGLKCHLYPDPPECTDINLVGGQRLKVSGDKTSFIAGVKTT